MSSNSNGQGKRLIKRYANRKLYDTETSSYVTIKQVLGFINEGREVSIIDNGHKTDVTLTSLLGDSGFREGLLSYAINAEGSLNDVVRSISSGSFGTSGSLGAAVNSGNSLGDNSGQSPSTVSNGSGSQSGRRSSTFVG